MVTYRAELWGCCQHHSAEQPVKFPLDALTVEAAVQETKDWLYWAGATGYRVFDEADTEVATEDGIDPMPFGSDDL